MSTLLRLIVLAGTLWAVNEYFGDQIINAFSPQESEELPVEEVEKRVNSKLPMYLAEGEIRWDSFKLNPHIAAYSFTLLNATKAELGDVYFDYDAHRRFTRIVCKTEGVNAIVRRGAAFSLSFKDRNGQFLKSLSIDSTECRHGSY